MFSPAITYLSSWVSASNRLDGVRFPGLWSDLLKDRQLNHEETTWNYIIISTTTGLDVR